MIQVKTQFDSIVTRWLKYIKLTMLRLFIFYQWLFLLYSSLLYNTYLSLVTQRLRNETISKIAFSDLLIFTSQQWIYTSKCIIEARYDRSLTNYLLLYPLSICHWFFLALGCLIQILVDVVNLRQGFGCESVDWLWAPLSNIINIKPL